MSQEYDRRQSGDDPSCCGERAMDTGALHVRAVRRDLPAVGSQVYFNTGTAGPLPQPAAVAISEFLHEQLTHGRANPLTYGRFDQLQEQVRRELAQFIGADEDEIALTHHTTDGLNLVIWGLPWQPDDWVLTTNLEHEGALLPLYELHRRRGVTVRFANLGLGERDAALAALSQWFDQQLNQQLDQQLDRRSDQQLDRRSDQRFDQRSDQWFDRDQITPAAPPDRPPRLLVLSHVSFASGALLPLAEIVALAHRYGTQVLVDGAQSVGAVPVDVHQLQVDYYAFPGQKWLCGPEGTGGLYVRRDRWAELEPTMLGWASLAEWPGVGPAYATDSPFFLPAAGARRYETGTVFPPGIAGLAAALRWRREVVGEAWAVNRIQQLVRYAREQLQSVPGLQLLTPGPTTIFAPGPPATPTTATSTPPATPPPAQPAMSTPSVAPPARSTPPATSAATSTPPATPPPAQPARPTPPAAPPATLPPPVAPPAAQPAVVAVSQAGLLHFRPLATRIRESVAANPTVISRWVQALLERNFIVRSIREPASVRLSISFFNTEDEIDSLVAALIGLQSQLR